MIITMEVKSTKTKMNSVGNDSYLLSVKHGADHSDAVHQVAPLVNNQVFPSLQPVEKKISRPAKIQI